MQLNSTEIADLIKQRIQQFKVVTEARDEGTIVSVNDGIVRIHGLSNVMQGEMLEFGGDLYGLALNLERDSVGAIVLGPYGELSEGMTVHSTGRILEVPVGNELLGRVVNSLGAPIDGKGPVNCNTYYPVEKIAPGVIARQSVSQPIQTGYKAVDSMVPIGRGQRELIIGDRQTGKTSIATDTIINQKGKDVICVYVAIGQKASTIAKLVSTLKAHGAMDYTIIVNATASDSASLQYIAPYAGTALAEYFMYSGKDVLIVYDDLSKHAVAYRAISLLLERSPGREAYPGDVFYLHSRLLERSARITDEAGGGSITALPIIETQAGDLSAYIPTNVISITDGQIFLESELFNAGQRPAVNVGLSVSRVGGAAQTKAMKKAAGSVRIDLAQYREMEVFTQFSSDLDEATKKQLAHGRALMELLKQPLGRPFTMAEQVIILVSANAHIFSDVALSDIKKFRADMLEFFKTEYPEIISTLESTKDLSEDTKAAIIDAATEFKKNQE